MNLVNKRNHLNVFILGIFLLIASGCKEEPPTADFVLGGGFSLDPNDFPSICADVTSVPFLNTSSGEIDSYLWEFEGGLATSSEENPSHIFDFGGLQEVKLTVTGPGGTDSETLNILSFETCWCPNWEVTSIYKGVGINYFRDNGLVKNLPTIKIHNTYSSAVTIKTYDPESWLAGIYDNVRGERTIFPGQTEVITASLMTNEWGIQLTDATGVKSCVRLIARIGQDSGSEFHIWTEDILDGVF